MNGLVAAPVLIPLGLAILLSLIGDRVSRRLMDVASVSACAAAVVILVWLAARTLSLPLVYWFGGWLPEGHLALGISFFVDPFGAGLAALTSFLGLVSFLFICAYFKEVKAYFHVMMLIFIGAMNGFCLTGDLFNLFVWFELMTASAVALCGYQSAEVGPLQGAWNFAIMNAVGAVLTLLGLSFLYARTGALNLAQIGLALAAAPPPPSFLISAFLFLCAGFLVKAAVAPFHFWLADAHAVAPTPVCVLFSGVMVELGLYALARIYWVVFSPVPGGLEAALRPVLLGAGTLTAVVGAVLAFGQRHLKRLLAFSTVAHVGVMLSGIALFSPDALAGVALYLVGHGLVKGALFVGVGTFLNRFGSVDEFELRGKGRDRWASEGLVLLLATLGLAGVPPFATFYGNAAISQAAKSRGDSWLIWVAVAVSAITGAAVLRSLARVYLGLGKGRDAASRDAMSGSGEKKETGGEPRELDFFLRIAAIVPVAASLLLGFAPRFREAALVASRQFVSVESYRAASFGGGLPKFSVPKGLLLGEEMPHVLISLFLMVSLAGLGLFADHLRIPGELRGMVRRLMRPLHAIHNGTIGDYVAWLVVGIAAYGGLMAWAIAHG